MSSSNQEGSDGIFETRTGKTFYTKHDYLDGLVDANRVVRSMAPLILDYTHAFAILRSEKFRRRIHYATYLAAQVAVLNSPSNRKSIFTPLVNRFKEERLDSWYKQRQGAFIILRDVVERNELSASPKFGERLRAVSTNSHINFNQMPVDRVFSQYVENLLDSFTGARLMGAQAFYDAVNKPYQTVNNGKIDF